jgi:hypothetical protein
MVDPESLTSSPDFARNRDMTLILTTLDTNKILQVSDQRLTFKGRSYDEHALKTIFMKSNDAACCISFTGRAYVGRPLRRTDFWLCDKLQALTSLSLPDLVDRLAANLTALDVGSDILTVVGAGYKDGTCLPLLFIISNAHDAQGNPFPVPVKRFTANYWAPHDNLQKLPVLVDVQGASRTVAGAARRHLQSFAKKRLPLATTSASANVLVYAIRASSQRSCLVGSNCIGVALAPGKNAEAFYWADGWAPTEVMPHVVTQNSTFMSIRVGGAIDSPSTMIPFENWPDLSATIEYEDDFFKVTNTGVSAWGFVRLDLNG